VRAQNICARNDHLKTVSFYDTNLNLTKVISPGGSTSTYTYRSFAATKGFVERELSLAA